MDLWHLFDSNSLIPLLKKYKMFQEEYGAIMAAGKQNANAAELGFMSVQMLTGK